LRARAAHRLLFRPSLRYRGGARGDFGRAHDGLYSAPFLRCFDRRLDARCRDILFWRPAGEKPARQPRPGEFKRRIVEADGSEHIFYYNRALGVTISLIVGYISS